MVSPLHIERRIKMNKNEVDRIDKLIISTLLLIASILSKNSKNVLSYQIERLKDEILKGSDKNDSSR